MQLDRLQSNKKWMLQPFLQSKSRDVLLYRADSLNAPWSPRLLFLSNLGQTRKQILELVEEKRLQKACVITHLSFPA